MIPIPQAPATSSRYVRQDNVFPAQRRRVTGVAVFVGAADPTFAMLLLAGMSAAGISRIGSDCDAHPRFHGHWLGEFHGMVQRINSDAAFRYLDRCAPASDVVGLFGHSAERWIVLQLNDAVGCLRMVRGLTADAVRARPLLVLTGPGGFVVHGCPDLEHARLFIEQTSHLAHSAAITPAGPPEFALAAAGVAITEVMLAPAPKEGPAAPEVAFYSLNRPRRTDAPKLAIDQFSEIAAPVGTSTTLEDRHIELVGAGGLGNAFCLVVGPEVSRLRVWDGDPTVELHNLNRQVLLLDGPSSGLPKAAVLASALRDLGRGSYEAVCQYVRDAKDLRPVKHQPPDAIVALPDNDDARLLCGDVAREAGVICATAGSSALGSQINVATPASACIRCQLQHQGLRGATGQSCALVANDAVVGTNFVAAGLLISELREALSGRRPCNVRYAADVRSGNRLTRMLTNPPCPHRKNTSRPAEPTEACTHA